MSSGDLTREREATGQGKGEKKEKSFSGDNIHKKFTARGGSRTSKLKDVRNRDIAFMKTTIPYKKKLRPEARYYLELGDLDVIKVFQEEQSKKTLKKEAKEEKSDLSQIFHYLSTEASKREKSGKGRVFARETGSGKKDIQRKGNITRRRRVALTKRRKKTLSSVERESFGNLSSPGGKNIALARRPGNRSPTYNVEKTLSSARRIKRQRLLRLNSGERARGIHGDEASPLTRTRSKREKHWVREFEGGTSRDGILRHATLAQKNRNCLRNFIQGGASTVERWKTGTELLINGCEDAYCKKKKTFLDKTRNKRGITRGEGDETKQKQVEKLGHMAETCGVQRTPGKTRMRKRKRGAGGGSNKLPILPASEKGEEKQKRRGKRHTWSRRRMLSDNTARKRRMPVSGRTGTGGGRLYSAIRGKGEAIKE